MDISKFLVKHPKMNYLQRTLRHISDTKFVDEVLDIGKNPLRIKILSKGDQNPGRLIYIAQTAGVDGLFAELRFIIHELYFADLFGFVPVVIMPTTSSYAEKEAINGTTNPFEYYFKPVSDISIDSALNSCGVVEHNYYQRLLINQKFGIKSGYEPSDAYLKAEADVVRKYIHMNNSTEKYINNSIYEILGDKRTLAVHVRGADFKRHYINHPNIITTQEYIETIDKILDKEDFLQIFLATDDSDALETFKHRYGNRVVYYEDVIRTSGDQTVMKSKVDRNQHHYNLGLEVLRDMYTLASCDGIVAGLSNVSIFSRIIKISKGTDYQIMNYLNKGIKR